MKKQTIVIASSLCLALCLTSCATIFSGSRQNILLTSNVDKSDKISVDGNEYLNVSFPYTVKIKRGSKASELHASREGYEDVSLYIRKKPNEIGLLNWTWMLPWLVDIATGAAMRAENNAYVLEFEKKQD